MIRVERFPTFEDAEAHRESWNALAERPAGGKLAAPSVFQTYEFTRAWWRSFGSKSDELVLLLAFNDDALVGVAPLMASKRSQPLPSKVMQVIGGSNFAADYCAFLAKDGSRAVLEAFAGWLEENPSLWNELELMNVQESSPELDVLRARFGRRFLKPALSFFYDAPTRVLGSPDDVADLVNRRSLKRRFHWFAGQGDLSYGHIESVDAALARLEAFFAQHQSRWSREPGAPSQFTDERQRAFYRELVQTMLPKGWVRFFSLELDGEPIAFHFGFEFAGKYYWYKPTFDLKYSQRSPGEVLLKTLFEYSIGRGLKEFDFTAGGEAYKFRYANQVRKLYRFRAYRSLPQCLFFHAEQGARIVARKLLAPLRKPRSTVPEQMGLLLFLDFTTCGLAEAAATLLAS